MFHHNSVAGSFPNDALGVEVLYFLPKYGSNRHRMHNILLYILVGSNYYSSLFPLYNSFVHVLYFSSNAAVGIVCKFISSFCCYKLIQLFTRPL